MTRLMVRAHVSTAAAPTLLPLPHHMPHFYSPTTSFSFFSSVFINLQPHQIYFLLRPLLSKFTLLSLDVHFTPSYNTSINLRLLLWHFLQQPRSSCFTPTVLLPSLFLHLLRLLNPSPFVLVYLQPPFLVPSLLLPHFQPSL